MGFPNANQWLNSVRSYHRSTKPKREPTEEDKAVHRAISFAGKEDKRSGSAQRGDE